LGALIIWSLSIYIHNKFTNKFLEKKVIDNHTCLTKMFANVY